MNIQYFGMTFQHQLSVELGRVVSAEKGFLFHGKNTDREAKRAMVRRADAV